MKKRYSDKYFVRFLFLAGIIFLKADKNKYYYPRHSVNSQERSRLKSATLGVTLGATFFMRSHPAQSQCLSAFKGHWGVTWHIWIKTIYS